MSIKIVRKVITKIDRKRNTANGNGRWTVTFSDGTKANTKPDAMWTASITGSETGEYEIEFDGKGQIVGWEKA